MRLKRSPRMSQPVQHASAAGTAAPPLPYPVAMCVMSYLASPPACDAMLEASAELRETVAVGLTLESVNRFRNSSRSASYAAVAPTRAEAILIDALLSRDRVPQQMMQNGGQFLRRVVADEAPAGARTLVWSSCPRDELFPRFLRRTLLRSPPSPCCVGGPCISSACDRVVDVRFLHHLDPTVACAVGHLECLRFIRGRSVGVDLSAKRSGLSALEWAAIGGHAECVDQLLQWGATVSTTPNRRGRTLAHYAAQGGHVGCLQLARDRGLPLDATDCTGKTPALFAAQHGRAGALCWLRDQGADVGHTDLAGKTACHLAARSGQLNCLQLLHDWGCVKLSVVDSSGKTPLHYAVVNGHSDCVAALAAWGGDTPAASASPAAAAAAVAKT